ncbi:hypothetical protein PTQ27_09125 [Mannheimia sp. AT1]|uniref:Uncharacterized protein n=1 Tax=Mannheimia cairinae TaxID=3025936 RepID=A0ABT5MUR6_9PAST|nr:hypothetical protein [Mannheimia cairinae]MDD0824618.1 hypothetical protein [Mannheimia cairinae]MDD0826453.1 hypothetical protein [Mannheimia cairinae]
MEIKDFSALQLALNACTGISTLAIATSNDPQSKAKLLNSLTAVKEVLDILENGQRNQSADMAYSMLYDAYHKALNAVNGHFEPETKN